MQDLAQYTRVDPTGRIIKYNNFIKRVHTTPKVNIIMEIFMSINRFPLIFPLY